MAKRVRYPSSGELLGHAAEFLRLKGYLRESEWSGPSYKTAQRFFAGARIEDPERLAISDRLARSLLPGLSLPPGVPQEIDVQPWRGAWLWGLLAEWDRLAGRMNARNYPLPADVGYALLPILRLATLDLGIRWGAYQALRTVHGLEPELEPAALADDGVRRVMDRYRSEALTLAELARKVPVSENALDDWRAGTAFPTDLNLSAVATLLARSSGGPEQEIQLELRVAVGLGKLRRELISRCGERRVLDLIATFGKVAKLVHGFVRFGPIEPADLDDALFDLVVQGARAGHGQAVCLFLANASAINQEVQADFAALPGPWEDRLNYWGKLVAGLAAPESLERLMAEIPHPVKPESGRTALAMTSELMLRMSDFDADPADYKHVYRLELPNRFKGYNRLLQAERAASTGDLQGAIEHLERAVKLDPEHYYHHYTLGAFLGNLVSAGRLDMVERAVLECRLAAQLAPDQHAPPTEVGIILSNAGRLEEAEDAFAAAEGVASGWHHFHCTRGINLMWLRRFDEAAKCLRRALELHADDHDARRCLAAVLVELGHPAEAMQHAARVAHAGGPRVRVPEEWKYVVPRCPNAGQRPHLPFPNLQSLP